VNAADGPEGCVRFFCTEDILLYRRPFVTPASLPVCSAGLCAGICGAGASLRAQRSNPDEIIQKTSGR